MTGGQRDLVRYTMQGLVIEQLLAEKEVLTVEQQTKLFDMIRQHSGRIGPALMRGDLAEPNQASSQGAYGDAT